MREKLFKQNYELLEKLAGEILTDNDMPNYSLIHQPEWISENYCIYGCYIERLTSNSMQVGTFYFMNNFKISNKNEGDFVSDPEIVVLINKDLKIARVTEFYSPMEYMYFECTETSKETSEEREYNDYLNRWLKETVENVQKNREIFTKIYHKD